MPTSASLSAGQVQGVLATVVGVDPVLVPTGIPASWSANVTINLDHYELRYSGTAGEVTTLSVSIPNPGLPDSNST